MRGVRHPSWSFLSAIPLFALPIFVISMVGCDWNHTHCSLKLGDPSRGTFTMSPPKRATTHDFVIGIPKSSNGLATFSGTLTVKNERGDVSQFAFASDSAVQGNWLDNQQQRALLITPQDRAQLYHVLNSGRRITVNIKLEPVAEGEIVLWYFAVARGNDKPTIPP